MPGVKRILVHADRLGPLLERAGLEGGELSPQLSGRGRRSLLHLLRPGSWCVGRALQLLYAAERDNKF